MGTPKARSGKRVSAKNRRDESVAPPTDEDPKVYPSQTNGDKIPPQRDTQKDAKKWFTPSKKDEAKLTKMVERHCAELTSFTEMDKLDVREMLRLHLYPGQHVLFRDHCEGKGADLRCVRREILCHSPNIHHVLACFQTIPEADQTGVFLCYIEPE